MMTVRGRRAGRRQCGVVGRRGVRYHVGEACVCVLLGSLESESKRHGPDRYRLQKVCKRIQKVVTPVQLRAGPLT